MVMTSKQYLLDTNILIDILNSIPKVMENLERVGIQRCCMSTISLHELYWGVRLPSIPLGFTAYMSVASLKN